jgi:hypothetical protein
MNAHLRDNLVALRDLAPLAKITYTNNAAVTADNAARAYTGTTTTVYDNDTMAGTAVLTCKTAGKFLCICEAYSAVLGNAHVYVTLNATPVAAGNVNPTNVGDQNKATARAEALLHLNVNDTIKAYYSHSAGAGIGAVTFTIQAHRIAA